MNDTSIQAVLFDFFGVFTPDPELILFEKINPQAVHEFFRIHDLGTLSGSDLKLKLAALPGSSAELVEAAFADTGLDTALLNLSLALKAQVKTALASNTAHSLLDSYWSGRVITDYFTAITISEELGVAKPEPEFFAKACAVLGVDPSEAVMIDDRPENLAGAEAAGLRTILFEGSGPLRDALAELGLELEAS